MDTIRHGTFEPPPAVKSQDWGRLDQRYVEIRNIKNGCVVTFNTFTSQPSVTFYFSSTDAATESINDFLNNLNFQF